MFGELAESILGVTAIELMRLDDEDKRLTDINEHLNHKEFVVHVWLKPTSYPCKLKSKEAQVPFQVENKVLKHLTVLKFATGDWKSI